MSLANLDATRNEAYLDYVEFEIPNPLPTSMVQLIYQNWDGETPRTLIENQLADMNNEMGSFSNRLLHKYMADSTDHTDSIYSLLDARKSISSKYRAMEVAVANNDFTKVNSYISQLENIEIPDSDFTEHNNFLNYIQFREALENNNKNILQLNETELINLRGMAEATNGRSAQLAQNILCFGYGECGSNLESEARSQSRRVYNMNKKFEDITLNSSVNISPNPVKSILTINIDNISNESQKSLKISNLQGQAVFQQTFYGNSNQFNLSELENGVYLYEVISNGESLAKDKIIIQH